MATFNTASIEAPVKKKVSLKALDKAITEYINSDKATFTVTVPGSKPMEFTFSNFVTPVLRKAYLDSLTGVCINTDSSTGVVTVDKALVDLMTYWFIFERLSDIPMPVLQDGPAGDVSTDKVSAYGTYFASISEKFSNLFLYLSRIGISECEDVADLLRDVAATALESADVNALLQNPEILDIIKKGFKEGQ